MCIILGGRSRYRVLRPREKSGFCTHALQAHILLQVLPFTGPHNTGSFPVGRGPNPVLPPLTFWPQGPHPGTDKLELLKSHPSRYIKHFLRK